MYPSYLELLENGRLREIADALYESYNHCYLCPRRCGVNRFKGETGRCRGSATARVTAAHPHFGEEKPLSGSRGSGTIFMSFCNLLCLYCQNWEISHGGEGEDVTDQELAVLMLRLQNQGCHNINIVSPTHFTPNIIRALEYAAQKGLQIPMVYNTGGYDDVEMLRRMKGVWDIYLPDYKYSDPKIAGRFSPECARYPETARAAIKEMFQHVGLLELNNDGTAKRGLMIRHLVLPNNLAGTEAFAMFAARELSPDVYINIMAQYYPVFKAHQFREISRRPTPEEHRFAIQTAQSFGLRNVH